MLATRPGFWVVYLLVALCVLTVEPAASAVVGGFYGAIRGSGHILLRAAIRRDLGRSLLRRRVVLRRRLGMTVATVSVLGVAWL
jgi:hypothetical protein